ncbi:vesicle coat protein [Coniochaeta sp. 2T2.1]|nr:vesicle coat protein [Coniochaeta sp. 2T2.1]
MTSILCLAHYCDIHGPTPLMVTEGLPVPCSVCYEHETPLYAVTTTPDDRPRTRTPTASQHATAAVAESLRRLSHVGAHRSASVPASEHDAQTHRAAVLRSAQLAGSSPAVESPPQSPGGPRRFSEQLPAQPKRSESGFRRTYDEYVTRRAAACDNCALTLPRRQESPDSEKGTDSRSERGPTLRTRAPCARVYAGAPDDSPVDSQASSSSAAASEDEAQPARRPTHRRTTSRSTASTSSAAHAHTHYLDYTSTHEPVSATSFSIVRASCLRTLSLETLPRPPATSFAQQPTTSSNTPVASPITPAFVTTHSAGSATSGGPIFFGDPSAGYTTAYIFRIPDVHARGHKRVYAFLALSTHRERLAMKSFGFIAAAFRDLAAWIQRLAESEAERSAASPISAVGSPIVANPGYGGFVSQTDVSIAASQGAGGASGGGSSFLTGGMGGMSRRMGAGFGGSGVSLKQRGLAELVGLPDFFIELHTRFVRLLLELGIELGS